MRFLKQPTLSLADMQSREENQDPELNFLALSAASRDPGICGVCESLNLFACFMTASINSNYWQILFQKLDTIALHQFYL
jgi:hypothetical protein